METSNLQTEQKGFQIIKSKRTAHRYCLCSISCPKQAIRIADQRPQHYVAYKHIVCGVGISEEPSLTKSVNQEVVLCFVDVTINNISWWNLSIRENLQIVNLLARYAFVLKDIQNTMCPAFQKLNGKGIDDMHDAPIGSIMFVVDFLLLKI